LTGDKGTILPIIGGVVGGGLTVWGSSRLNWHPVAVAGAGAIAGIAVAKTAKTPWIKQAGIGAAIGAAALGGVTLAGPLLQPRPTTVAQNQPPPGRKRGADGERDAEGSDGFVTRAELNDALSKLADSHKEVQKQQTCDLLTALRDEIKKVVSEGPNGPGASATATPLPPKAMAPPYTFFPPRVTNDLRSAEGDEYARNAYGDEMRDAAVDEYHRNAYGDDIRDAVADEYQRNAYSDERDAAGYDERDAGAYDERYAAGYDERDAGGYDERDGDPSETLASNTGGSSM
jgi:hypothetical protein